MTKFWYMDIKVNANVSIVFDLDDTLYNEFEFLKSAYREIAFRLDSKNWLELYAKMLSLYRSERNVFDFLSKEYQLQKKDLIKSYREHLPDIQLFPNVLEFFERIKDKQGYIGIITDGRKETQSNKIKALGIEKYIDYTVISEEIGSEKPSEKNFKAIEKHLKTNTFMYIADNLKKDFLTPKLLGWKTLALVDNGLNIHNNTYQYSRPQFRPDNYFVAFKDLRVV